MDAQGASVGKTGKGKGDAGAERKQRLAAELRANLKRRKARVRDAESRCPPAVKARNSSKGL